MLRSHAKRYVAAYWSRMKHKPHRRSLCKRLRRVTYPRARKLGPQFPAHFPSKLTFTKVIPA